MGVTQCTSGNTISSAFLAAGLSGGVHDNLNLSLTAAPLDCAVLPGPRPSEMIQQGSGQGLPCQKTRLRVPGGLMLIRIGPLPVLTSPADCAQSLPIIIDQTVQLAGSKSERERDGEGEGEREGEKVGRGGGTSSQRSKQRSRGERMGQGIQEAVLHDLPAVVSQGVFPASPCCFAGAFPCVSHRNVTLIWALISEAELPCQPCRDGYIAATLFLKICQWWQQVMDDKSSAAFGRLTH